MKKRNMLWILLLVLTPVVFTVVALKIATQDSLAMPRKIVPAAAALPPDRRVHIERERDWLRVGLRILQRRLDSLVADSIKQLNH